MNSKFRNTIFWFQSAITSVLAASSGHILEYLKSHNFSKELSFIILIIFILLCIRFTIMVTSWLVANSTIIRKMILGRDFIEGYWIDIVLFPNERKIREVGLIEIEYINDNLSVSGILFNLDYKRIGSFNSTVSSYKNQKLEYGYFRRAEHIRVEEASGLGNYFFTREKPFPLSFTGVFLDSDLDKKILIKGLRITEKDMRKKIESKKKEQLKEVLRHYVEKEFGNYEK